MKKIKYTFLLLVSFVVLTSMIYSTKNDTKLFELPPFNDTLILNLPSEPYNYRDIDFPDHVLEFIGGWGSDTSSLTTMTNEGATLGRALFYDVRLSGDNTLSCGSCHKQEFSFADNVALSDGIAGQFTNRNSTHLNDLLWQSGPFLFWDMRSLTMEDAVLQPILATNELGKNIPNLIAKLENTTFYAQLFEDAFGSPEITEEAIASALAQFIRSMSSFESPFDKGHKNNFSDFTASEFNGLQLFNNTCAMCHAIPHMAAGGGGGIFFPGIFGTNGLDSVITDVGAFEWTQDPFMMGVFKGPTLKNIEVTAPYMHDGRFETLSEVIDFYSEGVQWNENSTFNWMFGDTFDGYHFTEQEKEDIEAFLLTLTDQSFLTDAKWSNPWSATVSVDPFKNPDPFEVNLYPNPAGDFFKVEFENTNFEKINLDLFNINGQLVKSTTTKSSEVQIRRDGLPTGVYKLVLSNGANAQTKKIIFK